MRELTHVRLFDGNKQKHRKKTIILKLMYGTTKINHNENVFLSKIQYLISSSIVEL